MIVFEPWLLLLLAITTFENDTSYLMSHIRSTPVCMIGLNHPMYTPQTIFFFCTLPPPPSAFPKVT